MKRPSTAEITPGRGSKQKKSLEAKPMNQLDQTRSPVDSLRQFDKLIDLLLCSAPGLFRIFSKDSLHTLLRVTIFVVFQWTSPCAGLKSGCYL